MKTREQQRAQGAYEKIAAMKDADNDKAYGRVCIHLPELIHRNGLCQTVAFLEAKGAKKPWFAQVLGDLAAVTKLARSGQEFAAEVRKAQLSDYQRFTRESLACSQWFKRYAEAILKVDASEGVRDL